MDCADYLLSFMELEKEKDKKNGKEQDSDDDVTEGVARMGVTSKSGGFEYEERKV